MIYSENAINHFSEDGINLLRSTLRSLIPLVRVGNGADIFLQNMLTLKNLVSYLANFNEELELLMNTLRIINLLVSQRVSFIQ